MSLKSDQPVYCNNQRIKVLNMVGHCPEYWDWTVGEMDQDGMGYP